MITKLTTQRIPQQRILCKLAKKKKNSCNKNNKKAQ